MLPALVAAVLLAAQAQAAFAGWGNQQPIVPKSQFSGGSVEVGYDGSGGAVLAWSGWLDHYHYEGTLSKPRVSFRAAGARRFGAPAVISESRGANLQLQVADSGAAIALWDTAKGFEYAVKDPGGTFQAPVAVDHDWHIVGSPDLSMGADGSALIVWGADSGLDGGAIFRDGLSEFRAVPGFAKDIRWVSGSVDQRGDIALAWLDLAGGGNVLESTRPAGGQFGPARPARSEWSVNTGVVLTSTGEAILPAFHRYAVCPLQGTCETMPTPGPWQASAVDGKGNIYIAWAEKTAPDSKLRKILVARRAPGGTFDQGEVAARHLKTGYVDQIVANARGDLNLSWTPWTNNYGVMTTSKQTGGTWSRAVRATPRYYQGFAKGKTFEAVSQDIALDPFGRATIAWQVFGDAYPSRGLFTRDLSAGPMSSARSVVRCATCSSPNHRAG